MKTNLFTLFILSLTLFSCKSSKDITYLEGDEIGIMETASSYEVKIVPGDILAITVSAQDPMAVAIYNLQPISFLTPGETLISTTPNLQTYTVDSQGFLNFPVLGEIQTKGLTRHELARLIQNEIAKDTKNPIVSVQIMNFKVVVLGEVLKPGSYAITGDRVSLLDALGLAGDMTIYGDRKNVLLLRESGNKIERIYLDITDPRLIASPYYYLQQNDVVYIKPNSARQGNAKYSQNAQFNTSVASTIISAVSVIASLAIALLVKR